MKKEEEVPAGSPAWMSTFSDLMNLLLCFFVLLFSMSTVETAKLEQVAASMAQAFSIINSSGGGEAILEGGMISAGVTQLPDYANYFGDSLTKEGAGSDTENEGEHQNKGGNTSVSGDAQGENTSKGGPSEKEAEELLDKKMLNESEKMAEDIQKNAKRYGIQDQLDVDFNGQYVRFTLSGAFLFESGSAELKSNAVPLIKKISRILNRYENNMIEVEGHTDNVPIHSYKFENNNVLSMYRAMNVADDIRKYSDLKSSHIYSSGRGKYDPIASNNTPEGRARNRRVEIRVYNSYNSEELSN